MSNGYASAPQQKIGPQVPTITLAEYESEVKRILSTEQAKIDALKKEVENLQTLAASKRAHIDTLDQELADEMLKRRAAADALVAEAQARLDDTKSANDAAHSLYESALKDARQAEADAKSAKDLKSSLELELAVTRSKARELDSLIEKAKQKNLLIDSQVFELGQREAELTVRADALDQRSAELDGRAVELSTKEEKLNAHEASLGSLIVISQTARKEAEDAAEQLRITNEERAKFNADAEAVAAKIAGFIETENAQLARENRIKLDAKALQDALADLDRRRKNIEQREAALAQKI